MVAPETLRKVREWSAKAREAVDSAAGRTNREAIGMTNNAEARAREVLAEAIEADVIAFPSYATKRMAYYVRDTQAAQIWSGTVLRAMLAYGNERAAQERKANAAIVYKKAEAHQNALSSMRTPEQVDNQRYVIGLLNVLAASILTRVEQ